jgi:Fe2+ transport system protein FeoA
MTLDMAQPGGEYIVLGINGGCKLRRMLQERGLTEGANIRVIKGQPKGPFIVEFRSSRIMLDGMCARRIIIGKGEEGDYIPAGEYQFRGRGKCNRHQGRCRYDRFDGGIGR